MAPLVSRTHSPTTSNDNHSITIAVVILVICFVVIVIWIYSIGYPKHRAYKTRRAKQKKAHTDQQQWLDWIKDTCSVSITPANPRHAKLKERDTQQLRAISPVVLREDANGAMPRPTSVATMVSWPLRSYPPDLFAMSPSERSETPQILHGAKHQHQLMQSYETYRQGIGAVHRQTDSPHRSRGAVLAIEETAVIRWQSASPYTAEMAKGAVVPEGLAASIVDGSENGEFEDVDLGDSK
ncbi:hypothetical protein N0V90_011322 [Kalmusia sp. IMI 367209]|nr:hypothetical protein N0V90_011322 [Kalmusia sp. IMI 367209]